MRILLIHPPSKDMYQGYLPLGLAYIAGALLRHGHEIKVWDIDAEGWSRQEVLRRAGEEAGDYPLVGISALAGDYPYVKWLSRSLRRLHPGTRIIMGGYLASALPGFLMEALPIDFAAVGEGEETMVELAEALTLATDPGRVRGIYFRDNSGEIKATPSRPGLESLDRLPLPPWGHFPMDRYLMGAHPEGDGDSNLEGGGVVSIMASRGCPFNCNYCDHTIKGYRPRYRPVESVILEIRTLLEAYGNRIKRFYFWDDILICDRDWIQEFCDSLIREDLRIQWTCNCHVKKVEPRLMSHMKRAGCVNVRFGIETGSQKILDSLEKGVRVEEALEALTVCLEAGLDLTIYTMVGMTGEDRGTVGETVEFFRRLIQPLYAHQIRSISFFMLTPFPGTRIFERARKDGMLGDMDEFLEQGFDAYHDIPLNISGRTDEDLVALKAGLEREVMKILRDSRNSFHGLLYDMARELKT